MKKTLEYSNCNPYWSSSQENNTNGGKIQMEKWFLLSSLEFLDYINIKGYTIPNELILKINNIKTYKELDKLKNLNSYKNIFNILEEIINNNIHIHKYINNYSPNKEVIKSFNTEIENIFQPVKTINNKETFFVNDDKEQRIEFKLLIVNKKHPYRITNKLIRLGKEDHLNKIYDIFRARIIADSNDDLNIIYEKLQNHLQNPKLNKYLILRKKEKKESLINTAKDPSRKGFSLIGSYANIPTEFQFITKKDFEKSEAGVKHHSIYEFIQNCQVVEKLFKNIPYNYIKDYINLLKNDEEILKSHIKKETYTTKEISLLILKRLIDTDIKINYPFTIKQEKLFKLAQLNVLKKYGEDFEKIYNVNKLKKEIKKLQKRVVKIINNDL